MPPEATPRTCARTAWCGGRGLGVPAEPQRVALYLADHAGERRTSTLGLALITRQD